MSAVPPPGPVERRVVRLIVDPREYSGRRRLSPPLRIVLGLLLLVALGAMALSLPGVATRDLSFSDILFTSTSAVTVTGLSVVAVSIDFTRWGQFILLLLIQAGGVGFMVLAVLTFRLIGRHVSLLDRLALTRSLGLDQPTSIVRLLLRGLYFMLFVEALGAILLYIHWRVSGIVPSEDALFYAIFHSVSAFCNAGFDLFSGSPQYPAGLPHDNLTLIIMGLLVVIGGLGIPVIMDLLPMRIISERRHRRRRFSLHTRITLITMVVLTLIGWVGLLVGESGTGGLLLDVPAGERLVTTGFQSVSTRTAGFPGLQHFDLLSPESQLLVMGLMFIGSGPASMGGGITTGTFAVLAIALFSFVRGQPAAQIQRRAIAAGTVRRAAVVLALSLGVVMVAAWLLLLTQPFTMSQGLFEVVSAFATCGLSLGITGSLDSAGRLIIIIMMFWGRLGALTLVMSLLHRQSAKQLLAYPEEQILIG